jgi:GNAT superfamily N-acetyltransferase
LVYVDGVPAGHVFYAPAALVPRSTSFPTSPVGGDAILLTSAHVRPEFAGQGLGRVLVQTVARDAVKRGIRAVEAFGAARGFDDCLLPVGFLQAVGFKTVRRHPRVPRMRLDLRTTLSWREDVEAALDRLLATISAGHPSPA